MTATLLALALLIAAVGPAAWRLRRSPAFITGRDGRLSTSTALALAWTVILVWLLVAVLAHALTTGDSTRYLNADPGPLSPLATVYLPLLGGPYTALIGAKAVVGIRLQHGTLAKPASASPHRPLRELIANDSGRTDLVDLQYVALNTVTMLYVVAAFLADAEAGLPDLPPQLWALTGAPAGAYLLNKLATRPNPVITAVSLTNDTLTVRGGGFTPDARLELNGTPVPTTAPTPDTLTTPLPHPTHPLTAVVTSHGLRSDPYTHTPPTHTPAPHTPTTPTPTEDERTPAGDEGTPAGDERTPAGDELTPPGARPGR
ncbi:MULTISPECIES: hypothetical protein [Streptomyces]|uniref:hypothetical protein n=1 Tax=Streptomyces TaxID=1883 RepID=UPI001673ABBB|nr:MULTISPECIES: hypothetical protein [Streptomyces]MBD3579081.1 hypothetical protein [Streptomyces sp. KD18]GGT08011.1 hypothetical protein GCM10010286_36660 [Streptomyces toxytricini]